MAYQALYRKYRPNDFEDVVGQEGIVKTLMNSISLNRISHAFLFSGPRGTGKTTLAKILAKNVNCLNIVDGISCNKCENCLSIINNECSDIIEIDAASNNGVDEIREIRNKISLVPNQLKYKVYIIDEVHMLSIGAFNALLKTLEEPPQHVIFILATTDLHKVPITIISRCQCFEFKRISTNSIVNRLKEICNMEKISVDEKVLFKIASFSEGGMRDSLGMLDKLYSYSSNNNITLEDFYEINGVLDATYIEKTINAIIDNNAIEILNISDYIESSGKDYIIFVQDIIEYLRKQIIDFYVNDIKTIDINFLLFFVDKLNRLLVDLKSVSNIKIMFETSLLSLIKKNNDNDYQINNLDIISDRKVEVPSATQKNIDESDDISVKKYNYLKSKIINNTFCTAQKDLLLNFKNSFNLLDEYKFDDNYSAVATYLLDCNVRAVGKSELILSCLYESSLERGINLIDKIEKLLEKIYNKYYSVALVTDDEWNNEKTKFIDRKNNGVHYEYMSLENDNNKVVEGDTIMIDDGSIASSAIKLFGKDIVKIQ